MSAVIRKNPSVRKTCEKGEVCFYCNKPIASGTGDDYHHHDDFLVRWDGWEKSEPTWIYLHPGCAERLALRLIKDVRTGEEMDIAGETQKAVEEEVWVAEFDIVRATGRSFEESAELATLVVEHLRR